MDLKTHSDLKTTNFGQTLAQFLGFLLLKHGGAEGLGEC